MLKRLQDLTLEPQLLNHHQEPPRRRDRRELSAIRSIEADGLALGEFYRALAAARRLYALVVGKRFGEQIGVMPAEWTSYWAPSRRLDHRRPDHNGSAGALNLMTLTPLFIGKQYVWTVSLPTFGPRSFWVQAGRALLLGWGTPSTSPTPPRVARELSALRRRQPPRALQRATRSSTAPSKPSATPSCKECRCALDERAHELGHEQHRGILALYNQVLDSLFSYGVDICLGAQRDFEIKASCRRVSERSQERSRN